MTWIPSAARTHPLGEMISHLAKMGVSVPGGFATTAQAYRDFLQHDGPGARISKALAELDVDDVERLAVVGGSDSRMDSCDRSPTATARRDSADPTKNERRTRHRCRGAPPPRRPKILPDASFAGQQETFLNVRGRDALLKCDALKCSHRCYNDRAISYRVHQGFAHDIVALSAGIQYMVPFRCRLERRHVHARHRLRFP